VTRYELGLSSDKPRTITFAHGFKSTIAFKQFKNEAAMNRWLDAHGDDIELLEVRKD
jgi:quinol monooxygenase YgiN